MTGYLNTQKIYCGIDFGTSNSCVSLSQNGASRLIPLESGKAIIPSAIFFDENKNITRFGHSAVAAYVEQDEGRLMRAMKSILGTSLIRESTYIRSRAMPFPTILGYFFQYMRQQLCEAADQDVTEVVLGRPVRFVDENDRADASAQDSLEGIARAQGFKNIAFQYEPIAAALGFEQNLTKEELVLVADIGGGTSDFSIVRLSPERSLKADRTNDILANNGIHIGGTDFDRLLSLKEVMSEFGMGSMVTAKNLLMPSKYYNDLATWHRINSLYRNAVVTELKQIRRDAHQQHLVDRLLKMIDYRLGHLLAVEVEKAKVALSQEHKTTINFKCPPSHLEINVSRSKFEETIHPPIEKLGQAMMQTIKLAGISENEITAVFVTGGSTSIPLLQECIRTAFPSAQFIMGDLLGSVGVGLSIDAKRRFQ